MVEYRRPFRCEVITPTGKVFGGQVLSAIFPAPDGLVGVLGGRGPLVSLLGSGPFVVREMSGHREEYFVAGGFARFHENSLTLLAEDFTPVHQIDPEQAWTEIQEALNLAHKSAEQIALREEALKAARDKFNLAQKFQQKAGAI